MELEFNFSVFPRRMKGKNLTYEEHRINILKKCCLYNFLLADIEFRFC